MDTETKDRVPFSANEGAPHEILISIVRFVTLPCGKSSVGE